MKHELTLHNIKEIAKELRKLFKIGNIILINGPMGAGKTTLLKEILCEYPVGSPSFLHALTYGNKFLHIDAYTLTPEAFLSISIEDSLIDKCIIIEWGNLVEKLAMNFLAPKVIINIDHIKDKRILTVSKNGEKT